MARLDGEMKNFNIGKGGFAFTGARFDKLGASHYTLATIGLDVSGSISGFEDKLREMAIMAVESCKKSPMSDSIMIRTILISSMYPGGVSEIHGFKQLCDIDTAQYPRFTPGGGTPLNDGCYSGQGATNVFAKDLSEKDFGVNGLFYCITDGEENMSTATMSMVKDEFEKAVRGEILESMVTILVGINTAHCGAALSSYQQKAGFTHYIDAGNATQVKLAKIAGHISQSVSSQSQALGSGAPSQQIAPTI